MCENTSSSTRAEANHDKHSTLLDITSPRVPGPRTYAYKAARRVLAPTRYDSRTTGCETHLRVTPPTLMQSPRAPHHPPRELHAHTVPYSLRRAMRNHAHTHAGRPLLAVFIANPSPSSISSRVPLRRNTLLSRMECASESGRSIFSSPAMTMSSRMHMTPYHAQTGDDNRRVAAD